MDKQGLIESFKSFTGASDEESKFFLEANAWNLEVATSAFMDSEDVSEHPAAQPARPQPPTQSAPASKPSKPSGGRAGGVATFRDIANREEEDDESDDEHVEKYYAGGQKSGQMIHYPKEPGKGGKKDVVGDVFESAKQQGGKPVEDTPTAPSYFGGHGFKLGDNVTKSSVVKPAATQATRQEVHNVVTFWKNGFTVDNGPLRNLNDPTNEAFLADISKGLAPKELEQLAPPGSHFSVNLVDNRTQDYQEPPKPKVAAFSGSGNTLGSTPSTTTTTTTAAQKPATTPASSSFQVDESQPTTSIQLRLADGTRLVAKFNHHHTVGDIRRFVDMAKRSTQAYVLKTTFPPKVLSDNSQTISEAGLVNAVIVQQLA